MFVVYVYIIMYIVEKFCVFAAVKFWRMCKCNVIGFQELAVFILYQRELRKHWLRNCVTNLNLMHRIITENGE